MKVFWFSFRDRDRILQGLIKLAFSLLGIKTRSKESQNEKLWNIGSSLLVSLVHKHSHVTGTVFQNLVHEISQVQDSTQYTGIHFRTGKDLIQEFPTFYFFVFSNSLKLLGNE